MKQFILISFVLCSQFSWAQLSEQEILKQRSIHEAELLDTSNHMLDSMERASFISLDYFGFDASFQIEATFEKDKGRRFEMPTSTDRLPIYRRFGYVHFSLDSNDYTLTVYQNMGLKKEAGFEDYLFIPFRDATSKKTTYGGGRYLDTRIPEGKTILLDFNLAYNPYCAYSHHFSCPIPPEENTLKIAIEAGEKIPLAH